MRHNPTVLTAAFLASLALSTAHAASGDTTSSSSSTAGTATILIDQVTPSGLPGIWTLLGPDGKKTSSGEKTKVVADLPPGNYTLFVDPPAGAISTNRLYENGAEIAAVERNQLAFTITSAQSLHMVAIFLANVVTLFSGVLFFYRLFRK